LGVARKREQEVRADPRQGGLADREVTMTPPAFVQKKRLASRGPSREKHRSSTMVLAIMAERGGKNGLGETDPRDIKMRKGS